MALRIFGLCIGAIGLADAHRHQDLSTEVLDVQDLHWSEVAGAVARREDLAVMEDLIGGIGTMATTTLSPLDVDRTSDVELAKRRRMVHEADVTAVGQSGVVRAIWTIGAPGTKVNPLINAKGTNGCFTGMRMYSSMSLNRTATAHERATLPAEQTWIMAVEVDPVTWLTAKLAVKFRHAMMDAMMLQNKVDEEHVLQRCSTETTLQPSTMTGALNVSLHFSNTYLGMALKPSSWHTDYNHLKEYVGFMGLVYENVSTAAVGAQKAGWNLVGKAESADKSDACHLYQDPKSMDCALSFRGTDDAEDWINNINLAFVNFCGMRRVHWGFKHELNGLVKLAEFQTNVRPLLPKCKSVDLLGHSMGGAAAELFAGCANAKNAGKHYDRISWVKSEPAVLPAFTE